MTVIRGYLEMNWHKWIHDWKKNAQSQMVDGKIHRDVCPDFIKSAIWEQMCAIWEGYTFQKILTQCTTARRHSHLPHCTGSQSYNFFRERIQGTISHQPSCLEYWWHTLQKKGDGGYISPEVQGIAYIFQRLTREQSNQRDASGRQDIEVDPSTHTDVEMEDWLQDTRGTKKGWIIGMPRVQAYTVVPIARVRRCPPPGADCTSGSGVDPSLSDELFRRILKACMESIAIQSGALSRQQIYQLAQEVIHGSIDRSLSTDELLGLV